ncbi:MAG: phosphoribosylformylglycinamidine synthase subunit PurL [Chitinophagales bacterium]|nr:phosphoribosylformylglycinamidine synthase subunit PurL [Chitinophagales bacterium]MDW8393453.1 phosphoribosylformylglycinamidine synthase subunit PurL [Chitinophagales bacterium]
MAVAQQKLPEPSLQTAEELGLSAEEFERIRQLMGRMPNFTELSMFSAMWSEHCSYKNSILWLKTLPREGESLLTKAGDENAGLVDIGDGWACAFKIESHNHPSAIEPYQGAATGVGGIHRDIFTMGARPIAALNSLRFGLLTEARTRFLLRGVVKGIGDYGNAFGVPTVAGEVYFEPCYHTNPLVNAMSVGIVRIGQTVSAAAKGPGNAVFIVGSATGKDGIHGASFASQDIGADAHEDLPSVQVGDPFAEKLLLEASLEAIQTGAILGMQDMGAAGITCSTCEMSARAGTGMDIHLDRVPLRQANMLPWEILLSESQERMLLVVHSGREDEVLRIYEKWDVPCVKIGEVTDSGRVRCFMHGDLVADLHASWLVVGGGAPQYERPYHPAAYREKQQLFRLDALPVPDDLRAVAMQLAALPNMASKRWIREQYDDMVGLAHSKQKVCDAAVLRLPDSRRGLAVTVDCNARYVYADPYLGAQIAVAEAARNLVCSGARPLAITNCLNFGNPYDPEVYWQFVEAVRGMGDACRAFRTPVTGGNVSFYNQSESGPVFPTPTIGMIGVLEDAERSVPAAFQCQNDLIYLIGENRNDLNCSQYLSAICGVEHSPAPYFDLEQELRVQQAVATLIRKDLLASAHDVSEGGLFACLLESALWGNKGFDVSTDPELRPDAFLFGEAQGRIIVTVRPDKENEFLRCIMDLHVEFSCLGQVTEEALVIDQVHWGSLQEWRDAYENSLQRLLEAS